MMRRETAKWANAVRKAARVGEAYPGQVLDVVHAEFHCDPMSVLERIYAFIGWDIPELTRQAFAARIADKPELQFGAHRYDIADFGMTEGEVRGVFGDYVQRFDLGEKAR
jgi:hypothetical protein